MRNLSVIILFFILNFNGIRLFSFEPNLEKFIHKHGYNDYRNELKVINDSNYLFVFDSILINSKISLIIIGNSHFTELPDNYSKCTNITEIAIINHDVSKLSNLLKSLSKLKSITYLTILDTKELTFPKEIIDLEKLSSIDLENIGFVSFKFKLPKSLMGIRIFESNFISFDDNVEYHKLKYLSLDIEKMEKIPDNIDKFESIEEIGIGCEPMNKLLELNNFNFKSILELKKVKGLKKFSLGGVNLNNFGIPKEIFELSTIEELDLSSDSLNALVPEMTQLTNLKKLNLPWNQFKEVPKILCEMKKLEKVDLNYNEIRNKNVKIDVGRCKEIDISIEFNK